MSAVLYTSGFVFSLALFYLNDVNRFITVIRKVSRQAKCSPHCDRCDYSVDSGHFQVQKHQHILYRVRIGRIMLFTFIEFQN